MPGECLSRGQYHEAGYVPSEVTAIFFQTKLDTAAENGNTRSQQCRSLSMVTGNKVVVQLALAMDFANNLASI